MFNVVRTFPEPDSLKNKKKYDSDDVYESLNKIFFNKCYLCETKNPQDINIEHFEAHMGDIDKKFDWSNLFFVCSRCNNIKGARYNNLINPCDKDTDVFKAIKHLPPRTPRAGKVEIEQICESSSCTETSELLNKIFNNENTVNKRVSGAFLRNKIFKQYNLLLDQIDAYSSEVATLDEKNTAIEKIKVLISRESAYSAFIRWCVLEDEELGPLLEEFMD